jgi:3',5'-cyclic AMP phosphodiesterase CpdA
VPVELTTVADDEIVTHDGPVVRRYTGLTPDTEVVVDGVTVRTLPRPPGSMLARIVTVNDVHFGEVECGRIDDSPLGPILRGDHYPDVMNAGAIVEIAAVEPDVVVVKGDLTNAGRPEEFAAFRAAYGIFGDRLHVVRGNHDSYDGRRDYAGDAVVDGAGFRLVLLDTARAGRPNGWLDASQLDWLDTVAAEADRPVLVMGHHHPWLGGRRSEDYFGIRPDPSEALVAVIARRPQIAGYFAGHTHRNRVRHHPATGQMPYVEVGCVKDFPGSWAEYRVYEGGMLQIHHRISSPEALAWSEQCRVLYRDFGIDYVAYALGRLADRCFLIPSR